MRAGKPPGQAFPRIRIGWQDLLFKLITGSFSHGSRLCRKGDYRLRGGLALGKKIRVLHVEDNSDHALLIRRSLERENPDLEISNASDAEEALRLMETAEFDVVLSDYALGGGLNGLQLLEAIRERNPRLPFVVLTGQGNEEVASAALHAGANDYVIKRSGILQFKRLALILRNLYESSSAKRDKEEAEERLQFILEQASEAIFLSELDGRILEANPAASRLTGYSLEELRSMYVQDLHVPSERHISESELEKARRGDFQGFIATGNCKDGTKKECAVTGSLVHVGNRQLMLGLVMELPDNSQAPSREETERRIAEEAEARFKMAIEQAPLVAVQGYNREGSITYWNKASEDLYGFNRLTALGKTLDSLILDEEEGRRFQTELREVWDKARPSPPQEWRTHDRSGKERWVFSTMFPILEGGRCTGVFCMDLDITSRKEMEAELLARNEELEAFAYTVAHNLRAPLTTLDGYASLVLTSAEGRLSPDEVEYLERIKKASESMEELITSMLEFARSGRDLQNSENVDLHALVREIWADLRPAVELTGARLEQIFDYPMVVCDAMLMKQILTNLIDNALKFNTVSHDPMVETGSRDCGGKIAVYVRDNGPGIPSEEWESVFKPFKRLSYGTPGLGIGLSMVKRAVESWGGRVWIEAAPGSGSVFFFTVPDT
jgi:PAS domain S-box-containing protein